MKNQYSALVIKLGVALLICYAKISTLNAAIIHSHCFISAWGPIASTNVTGGVPADYRPGGNSENFNVFQMAPILNAVPPVPPPGSAQGCKYEISDITQVELNLTFTGTMVWDRIRFAGATGPTIDPINNITFQSGISQFFQFEPHLAMTITPGPIELSMPSSQSLGFTFFGDNNLFEITAATIKLSGNHYYVSGPSSMLFLLGFTALVFIRRPSELS